MTIAYEKYENMSSKQLLNALSNAQKKEQKIKDSLKGNTELIKFLKSKLKKNLDKPRFTPLEKCKAINDILASITPDEAKQLDCVIEKEMNADYGDEF